jgi:hypothetical protein
MGEYASRSGAAVACLLLAAAASVSFLATPPAAASHRQLNADRSDTAAGGVRSRRGPLISTTSTGAISGTVTDSSNKGLSGICVEVDGVEPTIGGGFATTVTGGSYTVTGLGSGTYEVEFSPGAECGNTGNFLAQW